MEYKYGMRLRGFSLGCQPKSGFIERIDSPTSRYYDVIVYDRALTDAEIAKYDLEIIQEEHMNRVREFRIEHGLTQQKVADVIGMPKRTLEEWEGERRTPPEWVENLVLEKLDRYVKEKGAD